MIGWVRQHSSQADPVQKEPPGLALHVRFFLVPMEPGWGGASACGRLKSLLRLCILGTKQQPCWTKLTEHEKPNRPSSHVPSMAARGLVGSRILVAFGSQPIAPYMDGNNNADAFEGARLRGMPRAM